MFPRSEHDYYFPVYVSRKRMHIPSWVICLLRVQPPLTTLTILGQTWNVEASVAMHHERFVKTLAQHPVAQFPSVAASVFGHQSHVHCSLVVVNPSSQRPSEWMTRGGGGRGCSRQRPAVCPPPLVK